MRFFRLRWLRLNLLFLLLVLLNAGPFGFVPLQGSGKDEQVIHTTKCLVKQGSPQQLQSEDSFDVIPVSAVTIFRKIIPPDYMPETSFDSFSADRFASLCRGSPRRMVNL